MNSKLLNDSIKLFDLANSKFIENNKSLFIDNVSERTFCGALMIEIYNIISESFKDYSNYFVDVEYNRARNGELKHCVKTIKGVDEHIIRINCDLIVHGRGLGKVITENLIAIEMKKEYRSKKSKTSDKERLIVLTAPIDEVYPWKGGISPKIVSGYILGVYYEIKEDGRIELEYYANGGVIKKI
jgi:hypothetical protein